MRVSSILFFIFGSMLSLLTSCNESRDIVSPDSCSGTLTFVYAFAYDNRIVLYTDYVGRIENKYGKLLEDTDQFNIEQAKQNLLKWDKSRGKKSEFFEITKIEFRQFLYDGTKHFGLIRRKYIGDKVLPYKEAPMLIVPFYPDGELIRYTSATDESGNVVVHDGL